MHTIISGTNRTGSYTYRIAKEYQQLLAAKGVEAGLLSLEGLNLSRRDKAYESIEEEIIVPTDHFLFIVPEYNGSFPGILKLFIDLSKSHRVWWNKKALLTGVSTGRAGNLRGMDHLTGILNYLKITVHPNKLPISVVDKLMEGDRLTDIPTLHAINHQLDEFIEWSRTQSS